MNAFSRLLFVATIHLASSIAVPARADVVTDWNNAALDAIRANNTAPPIASRSLAILHASIYDAVNGIARTNEPYLVPSVARRVHRVRPLPVPPHTGRSSICFRRMHLASMRSMRRFLLGFPTDRASALASCGENSSPPSYLSHAPMMVPLLLCSHPAAAAPGCGYLLRRRSCPICYRNGDSSRRLE